MFRFSVTLALLLTPSLQAQDSTYRVRIADLSILEGELPEHPAQAEGWWFQSQRQALAPRAVLLGAGEVYYDHPLWSTNRWSQEGPWNAGEGFLVVRAPRAEKVRGRLYFPDAGWTAQVGVSFEIGADSIIDSERDFWLAKQRHHARLLDRGLPGAAYFRHQHDQAHDALGKDAGADAPPEDPTGRGRATRADDELLETYALLSGGRALSENLQLDRLLPPTTDEADSVALSDIQGITVREFDWTPLLENSDPETDPLARFVPADQHAVFFPSFQALVDLLDETAELSEPLVTLYEERSQDGRTRERYEKQLCLELDTLARTFGALVIQSVAFTGSDPYLRTGSDVAILLETADPESARAILAFVQARQAAAAQDLTQQPIRLETEAGLIHALETPARDVSSYAGVLENCVVISNSWVQLTRLMEVAKDDTTSLGAGPEYAFFRERYIRGENDEAALVVVPDAAIRRWCGPRWRIASSRRTRAAAALAELQAEHLDGILAGAAPTALSNAGGAAKELAGLGEVTVTPQGVLSSLYGRLDFQTPIVELDLERVGKQEADLYRRWRDGYQQNWSRYFDPIAIQLVATEERIAFDMTVMPLIVGSEYGEFREFVGEAKLTAGSGDPHPDTFLHFAMAVDPDSGPIREVGEQMAGMMSAVGANMMDWMGGSLAVYLEDSPILDTLLAAEDAEAALDDAMEDANSIPIVVHFDVANGFKLAAFLTTFWAFVDQSAPGMLVRETQSAGELRYVRIREKALGKDLSLFYATTSTSFILSLNEEALLASLNRDEARRAAADEPELENRWLGESVAVEVDRRGIEIAELLQGSELAEHLRERSFRNLPILNEWKARFPDSDPVDLHARLWGDTLRCPGGGEYVWNAEHHTMESTQYGHPGAPRAGAGLPPVFENLTRLRLGLTFENEGLRSRGEVLRGSEDD